MFPFLDQQILEQAIDYAVLGMAVFGLVAAGIGIIAWLRQCD